MEDISVDIEMQYLRRLLRDDWPVVPLATAPSGARPAGVDLSTTLPFEEEVRAAKTSGVLFLALRGDKGAASLELLPFGSFLSIQNVKREIHTSRRPASRASRE